MPSIVLPADTAHEYQLYVNERNELMHVVRQGRSTTSTTITACSTSTNPMLYYSNATNFTTQTTSYLINQGLMFEPVHYWTGTAGTSTQWYYTGGFTGEVSALLKKARGPLIKKSVKSSIKRALKLMSGMGFEEEVRIFLGGNEIEVSHPESIFKFVITKYPNSLISRTERPGMSTPFQLALYTKTNVHVANLCVYMDKTPVLDQVLGVAMFIKSGSEEQLLRKANYFSLTTDMEVRKQIAEEVPYLEQKMRLDRQRIILPQDEAPAIVYDESDSYVLAA